MPKYIITLTDHTTLIKDENDTLDITIFRGYYTPHKSNSYNKLQRYISVKSYDMINLKFTYKKFCYNDTNYSEKETEANEYFKTLPKYDALNINKYVVTLSIKQILENLNHFIKHFRYYKKPIQYEEINLPIPSYVIGIWIGDGNSKDCGITNIDPEIIKAYTEYCENLGLTVNKGKDKNDIKYKASYNTNYRTKYTQKNIILNAIADRLNNMTYKDIAKKQSICRGTVSKYVNIYNQGGYEAIHKIYDDHLAKLNPFNLNLKKLNLINNKHIPDIYKKNSIENRLQLLAGFIDTDGSLSKTGYEISQGLKNERVFDDIKEIAESLGFKVTKTHCIKTCTYLGVKKDCPAVKGSITGDIHLIPVKVKHKQMTTVKSQRYDLLAFDIKEE